VCDAASGAEDNGIGYVIIGGLLVIAGVGLVAHSFTASVEFSNGAIEYTSLLGMDSLPLDKIKGRREYVVRGKGGSTHYLRLVPSDDRFQTMSFSKNYKFDDSFYKWFYSLPDLDARDKEAHKDEDFGLI
jgi:hypothetical protein